MLDYPHFFNRYTGELEKELIFADRMMHFLFNTRLGNWLFDTFLAHKPFSRFYGRKKDSLQGQESIHQFMADHHIAEEDFDLSDVKNFNDFFARGFLPGKRAFIGESNRLPAPTEGRYLAHEALDETLKVPVKGQFLRARDLLGDEKWGETFQGGPVLISRLAPVDYHRFHFPDDGKLIDQWRIPGKLYSVNPLCVSSRPQVYLQNERIVNILETENFGEIAYIEVGAFCVGRIVHREGKATFQRGEEKGYFLFGGSSVILLGKRGSFIPSHDLLEQTQKGRETFVRLGDEIARLPVEKTQ